MSYGNWKHLKCVFSFHNSVFNGISIIKPTTWVPQLKQSHTNPPFATTLFAKHILNSFFLSFFFFFFFLPFSSQTHKKIKNIKKSRNKLFFLYSSLQPSNLFFFFFCLSHLRPIKKIKKHTHGGTIAIGTSTGTDQSFSTQQRQSAALGDGRDRRRRSRPWFPPLGSWRGLEE